jgi:multidrug efflux system membrane fusion protein
MSFEGPSTPQPAFPGNGEQAHPHKNPWVRVVVYAVVIVLAVVVIWRLWQNQKQNAAVGVSQAAALASRPVPVQVTVAEQRTMPIFLTALGTATPYMSVTVKARVSGQLEPVKFTEGQQVRQGQTIMVIDPKPYQAELAQAKGTLEHDQALLKNAQAQYARYKALYDAGVTSKETLDADEATLGQYQGAIASDKAAIQTAQLQLNWCYIQAPISGKIGLRMVDPGNIIAAGTTNLVMINQLEPIAVYFTVPEGRLPQVLHKLLTEHKMPVEAWDRGDTQKLATGYLLTADNQIDTTTGTGKLKAVFDNRDQALYPNQFVNIHLVLENRENAVVVPSAAIQTGTVGSFVWTVDTGADKKTTARMQPVKVALTEGQLTILESGLSGGEPVVIDGADRLRPGSTISISAAQHAAPPAGSLSGGNPSAGAHPRDHGTGGRGGQSGQPGEKRNRQ